MGNICRSPAAEAVFLKLIEQKGLSHRFEVDSAATGGWHQGDRADPRSSGEGRRRGYSLQSRARQVSEKDWDYFDYLICMDYGNQRDLIRMGAPEEKVRLLLRWHPDDMQKEVPDPYYGGEKGFIHMYDLIETACENLVDALANR